MDSTETAAWLTGGFLGAIAAAVVLSRRFASVAARRGADVMGFWDRQGAFGTGPIAGPRAIWQDDIKVGRLLLRHQGERELESLRLLTWLAVGVVLTVFASICVLAADASANVVGLVIRCGLTVAAIFWLAELVQSVARRDRKWTIASGAALAVVILASLALW
jgi:hypothetical protein